MDRQLEEEEELVVPTRQLATTLFVIISLLVVITVAFEKAKEMMVEFATKVMKRVVLSLFSELTVLGFLSLVTFTVSKMEVLNRISVNVFGDTPEREEYLESLLESVHYILFLVMVLFIGQVSLLLKFARHQAVVWSRMQKLCNDDNPHKRHDLERVVEWLQQETVGRGLLRPVRNLFSGYSMRYRQMVEILLFDAMREEFLNPRSQLPPFAPVEDEALDPAFDYGKYMTYQLAGFLEEIIEVPWYTWASTWILIVLFTWFMMVTSGDPQRLAWAWLAIGWIMILCHMVFQRYLNRALAMCCNRKYFVRPKLHSWFAFADLDRHLETRLLIHDHRPAWTALDLPDPHERGKCDRWCRGVPNRQHLLFPFQLHSRFMHEYLARLYVLCFTVYTSLLAFEFLKIMVHESSGWELLCYILFSVTPIAYYAYTLSTFVKTVVEVNSLRIFKHASHVINTVVRDQKAERAIRAIILLNDMRMHFLSSDVFTANDEEDDGVDYVSKLTAEQLNEISSTFDLYDIDKGGDIDVCEFRELMKSLGVMMTEEEAQHNLSYLDDDGNGTISKDEFIRWHAKVVAKKSEHPPTIDEMVENLFTLFDFDGEDEDGEGGGEPDGVITVKEFKEVLNKFHARLSDEEVAMLLSELDEDDSGTIDKEEFKGLLERYADEDLIAPEHHDHRGH